MEGILELLHKHQAVLDGQAVVSKSPFATKFSNCLPRHGFNTKPQSLIMILWKTYPTHPAGQNSRVYFPAVLMNTSNTKSWNSQSLG